MKKTKPFPIPVKTRSNYNCAKCPGWCCTYDEIEITAFDIKRLAKHFGISAEAAEKRFTKRRREDDAFLLRHKEDTIFDTACQFLDQEKRNCTVYEARPGVCRKFPEVARCGYYDFLKWERVQQGDDEFIATT